MNNIIKAKFIELPESEAIELYGGKGGGWWAAFDFLIDHGQDMWEGFSDGWNGRPRQ